MTEFSQIPFFQFIPLIILIFILFLPSCISLKNNHKNKKLIFLANFLTGWTVIGWLILLIWSVNPPLKIESLVEGKNGQN